MWTFILWFKEAFKGLFRNILMNSFALLLSVVCFSLLAIFTIIGLNAKYISSSGEDKIQIVLYLKDEVKDYQSIQNKIQEMKQVKSYTFISKDEAYQKMKQELGKREKMLTNLGFNPLPASFELKLHNPRDINKVVKTLESWGVAKDIKFGKEFIDNFFKVTDKINQTAFWIVIIMSVATGAVIYSSIRMNILNRNKEIEIKDLIGAGMLNIRIPFILEAMLLTLFSASLVLVCVYYVYEKGIHFVMKDLPINLFMSVSDVILKLTPTMLGVAVIIALISSILSTQRYLKRH
ncbi:permease-like cell division protein FtsX [Bacillus sp. Brlt_9]|uniref:cell division protein FtsX n=1 Tax=Bacillus sp. Brlt_9 TaxID=3110916 RepID=UPI000B4B7D13